MSNVILETPNQTQESLMITCLDAEMLKRLLEKTISDELNLLSDSMQRLNNQLQNFEIKYQLKTEEFLQRYENDEFEETLDLDEWIGTDLMLKRLRERVEKLRSIN
ncbi:MAG TPA: hypothetical protein V6C58_16970 [Allocoleopsis sp.]